MTRAYFSLGSNLDPREHLELGVRELSRRCGPLELSPVYRNEAVGFDGPEFLNMVARCGTDRSPQELLETIEDIHRLAGRERGAERYSNRTLDIDLLLYGSEAYTSSEIELPRRDVLKYAFVLKPLADLAPDETHPLTGRSYRDHWAAFSGYVTLTPEALCFEDA